MYTPPESWPWESHAVVLVVVEEGLVIVVVMVVLVVDKTVVLGVLELDLYLRKVLLVLGM